MVALLPSEIRRGNLIYNLIQKNTPKVIIICPTLACGAHLKRGKIVMSLANTYIAWGSFHLFIECV